MAEDCERKKRKGRPPRQVAIFGAGIAGLTAAHELVERGYDVEVFEMEKPSVPEDGIGVPCAIGGMARTQWARADEEEDRQPPLHFDTTKRAEPLSEQVLNLRIDFYPNSLRYRHPSEAHEHLQKVADILSLKAHRNWKIEVRGHWHRDSEVITEPVCSYPTHRRDWDRALKVSKDLLGRKVNEDQIIRGAFGLGYRDDWRPQPEDRHYVDFRIRENWFPGEHGFRFFPAFYRNLFDTMSRTPIPEDRPDYLETFRTVLDNVLPTEVFGLVTERTKRPVQYTRRPLSSLQQIFDQLVDSMLAMGLTFADLELFHLKLFKYLTSCSQRRAKEYEKISWAEFVEKERYSQGFQNHLESAAEALVAMSATESDARTYGNISMQMLLDQIALGRRTDGTLNGPSSLVWFDHWRRYLERQGVLFRRGELISFIKHFGKTWAKVALVDLDKPKDPRPADTVIDRDFYVVALSAPGAQQVALNCEREAAEDRYSHVDLDRIRTFPLGVATQPNTGGAMAHMAGIQYFFATDISILKGHILFPDTKWRLSAVSQPQFWIRKRGWWSGYRGILSVDISNWKNGAWNLTSQQIAEQVWTTIKNALTSGETKDECGRPLPKIAAASIPEPTYFHIDENILFHDDKPAQNKTPLLINRPDEFHKRPGIPGEYKVVGGVVLAGTYMQTFTRLTTMEAANESGRHAANAILLADVDGERALYKGELAYIGNPEENEPPDAKFFVELDQKLFACELPHFVDILDMRRLPRELLRDDPVATLQQVQTMITERMNG